MDWVWSQVNRLTKGYVPCPPVRKKEHWNVLLVHAHPVENSFSNALATAAKEGLEKAGHKVKKISLYNVDDDGTVFQPCLTSNERENYMTIYPTPSEDTKALVEDLRQADALVFIYPTWWFNVPAVLKGFIDRTFLPGAAFYLPHLEPNARPTTSSGLVPGFTNIKKVACVSTYGAPEHIVFFAGDNGRNMISRGLLPLFSSSCTITWLGLYNMDVQTQAKREKFIESVETSFRKF